MSVDKVDLFQSHLGLLQFAATPTWISCFATVVPFGASLSLPLALAR